MGKGKPEASCAGYRVACLDLPGFGDAADREGRDVAGMVAAVIETLATLLPSNRGGRESTPWLLGGHSMGGKIATVAATMIEAGATALYPPAGLLLVSSSPPSPEPMPERKREQLIDELGTNAADRVRAVRSTAAPEG